MESFARPGLCRTASGSRFCQPSGARARGRAVAASRTLDARKLGRPGLAHRLLPREAMNIAPALRRFASLGCLGVGAFLSMATSYANWHRQATLEGAADLRSDAAEVTVPLIARIDSPTELDQLMILVHVHASIPQETGQGSLPDAVLVNDETGEEVAVQWDTNGSPWDRFGTVGPIFFCEGQAGLCEASATLRVILADARPVHFAWTAVATADALGDDPGGALLVHE